jgi:hypothetical protein
VLGDRRAAPTFDRQTDWPAREKADDVVVINIEVNRRRAKEELYILERYTARGKRNRARDHDALPRTLFILFATFLRAGIAWLPRIFALPPPADAPLPLLLVVKTQPARFSSANSRSLTSHAALGGGADDFAWTYGMKFHFFSYQYVDVQ